MFALIVFINGFSIMVLEMAGARLLAPWLGTSITVWTSLIGSILASLSLGAYLGGKLADSTLSVNDKQKKQKELKESFINSKKILFSLLISNVFFITATATFSSSVLLLLTSKSYPLPLLTLISSLILFMLPSLICGMVPTFVTRIAITNSKLVGSTIGLLSAIGTLGSILGTFFGGFVLISWFSIKTIFFGVAICFLLAALLTSINRRSLIISLAALITTIAFYILSNSQAFSSHLDVVETKYNSVTISKGIFNNEKAIFMLTDPGSSQSGMIESDPNKLIFEYTKYYEIATQLKPDATKILMLGGGGYSIPKWLLSYKKSGKPNLNNVDTLSIDVVELDEGITKIAEEYFSAPTKDSRVNIYHQDARMFLNSSRDYNSYDLIFMDVFNSYYSIPFHVGTVEATELMSKLLKDDGYLVCNVISSIDGKNGRLFQSIYGSFLKTFPQVEVFAVHTKNPNTIQNIMILASKKNLPVDYLDNIKISTNINPKESLWTRKIAITVPPLYDNYAPVERYVTNFGSSN